jgi:hypothetical protein
MLFSLKPKERIMFSKPTHKASFGERMAGDSKPTHDAGLGDFSAVDTRQASFGEWISGSSQATHQADFGDRVMGLSQPVRKKNGGLFG